MSIIETSEFLASSSKNIEDTPDVGSSSFVETNNVDQENCESRAAPTLPVVDRNTSRPHELFGEVFELLYPPLNGLPCTETELYRFLGSKARTLVIFPSGGIPVLEDDPNFVCIALRSPYAWRFGSYGMVQRSIALLANIIGQVAVIGESCPASKEAEFEMRFLAAALRSRGLPVAHVRRYLPDGFATIGLALAREISHRELQEDRRFLPLGYRDKTSFFWSFPRKCVLEYSPSDMTNAGTLTLLCGDEWLRENHGYPTKNGQYKVDYRDVGVKIMEECSNIGLYKISHTYGAGVWRDPTDNDCLIVNNGDDIWRTDGRYQSRVGERFVYTASRTLNLGLKDDSADESEAHIILSDFSSWNWKRKCDPVLLLGWLMSASFPGALEWRVHAAVTGKKGTGKSTLLTMIKGLLGDFLISCSGSSTEPSIRRQIKNDSLAIAVDEAEKDSPNVKALMSYLRASSSGDKDMKTNRNDGVDIYTVRSTGLISAVDLPQFLPADEGRYIHFSLVGAPLLRNKPGMAQENSSWAQRTGTRLKSRMIHSWPRYRYCLGIIRSVLVNQEDMTQRYADSLSTILSAAWVALYDGVVSEDEAIKFISGMDFSEEKQQLEEAADDSSFMDHALDSVVNVYLRSNPEKMPLRMVIEKAAKNDRNAERSIQMYGLRTFKSDEGFRLLVDEKNTEFKRLFRDTKWNNANFVTTLKRIPGVSSTRHKETNIGGKTVRPFSIPFHIQEDVA